MAGTQEIRSGEMVVFLKVVAVTTAVVKKKKKGYIRTEGSPCGHATLGPLEDSLDAKAGRFDGIAAGADLNARLAKGERDRSAA